MHSKPVVYNYLLKGAAAMANLFTKEEQEILRANPYTLSVNDRQIKFTVEFKRYLLNEIAKPGVTHKMAFRKLGYDPEMLGAHRVDTIVRSARKQAASPEGPLSPEVIDTRLRDLQKELLKTQQELAFLKKILQLPPEDNGTP